MKYHIITYGCQANISDSEKIINALENSEYTKASDINEADLIIINMCSVRQSAVDRVYGKLEKFKKLNNPKTILTGCILKKDKRKFGKLFDHVLDIREIDNWPMVKSSVSPILNLDSPTAFIHIISGCNNFCSYCVVPYTRGRETSKSAKEIICEIQNLVKQGVKEIWLLGQNVNSYDDKKTTFPKLLEMIDNIEGNFWVRFTSSHPKDFSNELIKAMAKCEKITPYLNLPVQSGDNQILRQMNRNYTVKDYTRIVKDVRKEIPNITLSTDVIVGFPGETQQQFENTLNLFKESKFDMAYISKYSVRSGTAAEKLLDSVPQQEKNKREKALTEMLKQTALKNNKRQIGQTTEAFITHKKKDSWIGKTKDYKTIQIISDENLLGKFVKIEITQALEWGLKGKYV